MEMKYDDDDMEERFWEKEGFKTRVEDALRNVINRSRIRAWRCRRAALWCSKL